MKVAVIADVSGSVIEDNLRSILVPTVVSLFEAGHDVYLVLGDTEIRSIIGPAREWTSESLQKGSLINYLGRGGTDMITVRLQTLKQLNPDQLVIITDGFY